MFLPTIKDNMNKFILMSLFVTSVACATGYCSAFERNVTEEKTECDYIKAKKARNYKPIVGYYPSFKLQLSLPDVDIFNDEEDCPVPTTPPTKE